MIRSLTAILCVFCVGTVLSQLMGLAFLWSRGQLTADTLKEIRVALDSGSQVTFDEDSSPLTAQVSSSEVLRERAMRVLDLTTQADEVALLKELVNTRADRLLEEQQAFESRKQVFEDELTALNARMVGEATEQTRGILLALQPQDAVEYLMTLTLDENLVILKGLQERRIAKIKEQFLIEPAEKRERGQKIFAALSRGEPTKTLIDTALEQPAAD
jgi:hypothetical protein